MARRVKVSAYVRTRKDQQGRLLSLRVIQPHTRQRPHKQVASPTGAPEHGGYAEKPVQDDGVG